MWVVRRNGQVMTGSERMDQVFIFPHDAVLNLGDTDLQRW